MANVGLLKDAFARAEKDAGNMEIDEIAFLIGSFPLGHFVRDNVADCPRIAKLLPEMEPCASETEALLRISSYMNKECIVGETADRIRRAVRS